MTLYILDQLPGSDPVFPDRVGAHLIEISDMDTGYGEDPDVAGLIEVTYARTQNGIPPQRLDDLVNTDFPEPPGARDILIAGVDHDFAVTLSDGTMTTINFVSGTALRPGQGSNTTATILVIYDTSQCNGDGYWVVDSNGDPTNFRSSVLLYHELSHAHDFAQGSTTSTEPDAHADENDMRAQVGDTLRHATDHQGACGGGDTSCCMVASVATGSAYSAEVAALRRLRDSLLRTTDVGHDFFERLHYQYYAFSPQVCSAMARDPHLHDCIRSYVVEPLVVVLETLRSYAVVAAGPTEVGRVFARAVRGSALDRFGRQDLRAARRFLADPGVGPSTMQRDAVDELLVAVSKTAHPGSVAHWALLQPLGIGLDALEVLLSGAAHRDVGQALTDGFEEWLSELPLTDVWDEMSETRVRQELAALGTNVLRTDAARVRFASRLLERETPSLKNVLLSKDAFTKVVS